MRKVLSFIRLLSDHQTLLSTIKCFSGLHTHFHFSSILQLSNKSNSSNSVSITYSLWWQQHHQTVLRKSKDRFSVKDTPEHLPLADLEPVRLTSLSASCKDRPVDRAGTLKAGSPGDQSQHQVTVGRTYLSEMTNYKSNYTCVEIMNWQVIFIFIQIYSYRHIRVCVRFLRPWIIHNNNQAKTYYHNC